MKQIYLIVFLGMLLLCSSGYSQSGPPAFDPFTQVSNVNVASPNAASLGKFVEFPIGLFNGTPNISIPLYEIKSGDITVPISLGYHSSGIKVNEESGLVGLGWALNAGGVIIKEIKGEDDDYTGSTSAFNRLFPYPDWNQYKISNVNVYKAQCDPLTYGNYFDKDGNPYLTNGVLEVIPTSPPIVGPVGDSPTKDLLFGIKKDGEPDLYMYNFGNYSGKFINASFEQNNLYDVNSNNIRFVVTFTSNVNGASIPSIIANSPDGYMYYFTAIEGSFSLPFYTGNNPEVHSAFYLTTVTSPLGKNVVFNYRTFSDIYGENALANGWMLSYPNITATLGIVPGFVPQVTSISEIAEVIFASDNTDLIPAGAFNAGVYVAGPSDSPGIKRSLTTSYTNALYLSSITFDNGYVEFIHGTRQDMYGVKLDQLNVKDNNGNTIKSVAFNYDYFIGEKRGNEVYDLPLFAQDNINTNPPDYPLIYRQNRLKLLSIQDGDSQYSFSYYDSPTLKIPYKSSFSQDYWGYYNGAANNTMVPDFRRYQTMEPYAPPVFSSFNGANREPNEDYAIAGMLKTVTYPTKGWDSFEYEMHRYTNFNTDGGGGNPVSQLHTINLTDINQGATIANFGNVQQQLFTVPGGGLAGVYADVTGDLFCNGFGNFSDCVNGSIGWNCGSLASASSYSLAQNVLYAIIEYQKSDGTFDIYQSQGYGQLQWDLYNLHNCTSSAGGGHIAARIFLPPGVYRVTVNYPDNHTPAASGPDSRYASLNLQYYVTSTNNGSATTILPNLGGGLRVKTVTKYDPVADNLSSKSYQYGAGILTSKPLFYDMTTKIKNVTVDHPTQYYYYFYLFSNSSIPYSYAANGNMIGYTMVTESFTGSTIGKTVYNYTIRPDSLIYDAKQYIPGVPSTSHLDNGFLNKVTHYNSGNNKIKETINTPLIETAQTYWSFKYENDWDINVDDLAWCVNLNVNFYPIQMGKLVTRQTIEREYNPDGSTYVESVTNYNYNSQGYLRTQSFTNSNGKTAIKQMAYPMDYSTVTGWVKDLWAKNRIDQPLETLEMVSVAGGNASVTGGAFVVYTTHDGLTTPSQVYKVETANPDAAIQSTAPANLPPGNTAFVLNGTVQYNADGNLAFSQKANDLPVSYIWGYNKSLPVAKAINALPGDLFYEGFEEATANTATGGAKTGKKYFTGSSYTKNISGLTNGSYTVSYWRLNNGAWQPVNNTFTGTSYNLTITLNGGITGIDEVRIYPANARMTTYTYDPLIGMTSSTDENNITIYYEYDSNGRLANLRDYQNNIVKHYTYHYAGN